MEQGLLSVVANGAGGKPGITPHYRLHLERIAALTETGRAHATQSISDTSVIRQTTLKGTRKTCGVSAVELPTWIPADTWLDFEQMRKAIRKPMTPAASRLTIQKLDELRQQGEDPQRVLEQSIQNSWVGVFPLKGARGTPASRPSRHSGFDELDYSKGVGDDGSLN